MSMLWFRALHEYAYAMRVDEEVCLTRLPTEALVAALAVDCAQESHPNRRPAKTLPTCGPTSPRYHTLCTDAFGLETKEMHRETIETFEPWIRAYMSETGLEPAIPPLPTESIYFTNFFVTRVGWWRKPEVQAFMDAVNASGGIYRHRWGDAPIQTAVLRLLGLSRSVRHLDVDYLHLSTQNRIVRGEEVTFSTEG
eukprot:2174842-Prymnesium_polylepis.1